MAGWSASKEHWCKEMLEKNGTLVLRELLKKQVTDLYRPYDMASLLSKASANGDLAVKRNQFKQEINKLNFNCDEKKKLDSGNIDIFDISLLTRLLKIPKIGGISCDIVSQKRWAEIMKQGENGNVDFMFFPRKLDRSGIDERLEVKLAGLITGLQYYRNKLSHKTDNGCLPPNFWVRATNDIEKTINELLSFSGLEEHKLIKISTTVVDESKLSEITRHLTDGVESVENAKIVIQGISNKRKGDLVTENPKKRHCTEQFYWPNVMNGWSQNSNQAIQSERYMGDLPDYTLVGLLSMLGDMQLPSDKLLESGFRLFQLNIDELHASMPYFERFILKYPSEAIIVKINNGLCGAQLPANIIRIDDSYELYDIRGKVTVLQQVQVHDSENWNSISNFLNNNSDYESCHDINIPIKITVTRSVETASKIHSLISENRKLVSVGGVLLSNVADRLFTEDVIKINMKLKHAIINIIKSDSRLPALDLFDPYIKTRIRDKFKSWPLHKIAINQWHPSAVRVIEDELEDYTKFFNDLGSLNVFTITEKVEIILKLQDEGKNVALTSLFGLLQERNEESDINALINIIKREKMLPLFYFIKDIIMQVRRLKNYGARNPTDEVKTKQLDIKIYNKNEEANADSVLHLNPNQHMVDDPEACIGALFHGYGENPSAKTGCVEITVDVSSQWEVENIKKSIESGTFLNKYFHWLREKGVNVKEEKDIEIKLCLGNEILLVKSQDTKISKLHVEDTLHNWLEGIFRNIANDLGADWEIVALVLGVPQARIDDMTKRHTKEERRALHMLYEWSESYGPNREQQVGDKLKKLLKSLHKCHCYDMIDSIESSETVSESNNLLLTAKQSISILQKDTLHNWLEGIFRNIANDLGADWEIVALVLGVPQARIDDLTKRHTKEERRALHMLYEWSESYGPNREQQVGDKLKKLLKSLHKCHCYDMIDSIESSETVSESNNLLLTAKQSISILQKATVKENRQPSQIQKGSLSNTEEGMSSKQTSNTKPNLTNPTELSEDNKENVLRLVIEQYEISISKKTHSLVRAEKSLEKKNIQIEELELQVSSQQKVIQEKESHIIQIENRIGKLCDCLAETSSGSQISQEVVNLSHLTKEISRFSQQINTVCSVCSQHLRLSDQFYQTGRALSQQMQRHHSESTLQQVQVKEELSEQMQVENDTLQLDAGRAAAIQVNCRNPKFRKHQKDIEMHMEPDSELLDQFFVEGIIDPDDRRVIESESEILGKRKRILLLMDKDDTKYRKVVRALKECSDTGTNYALGQLMEKDV